MRLSRTPDNGPIDYKLDSENPFKEFDSVAGFGPCSESIIEATNSRSQTPSPKLSDFGSWLALGVHCSSILQAQRVIRTVHLLTIHLITQRDEQHDSSQQFRSVSHEIQCSWPEYFQLSGWSKV